MKPNFHALYVIKFIFNFFAGCATRCAFLLLSYSAPIFDGSFSVYVCRMETSAVQILLKNSKEDFNIAANTLIRISNNILNNIENEKYRSVRIDSKAFQEKLIPFDGAIQCLLEMGFQEDNDRFTLFLGSNLNDLKAIRQHLLKGISLKNNTFRPELEASQKEVWSRLAFVKPRPFPLRIAVVFNLYARPFHQGTLPCCQEPPDIKHCLLLELLAWFKRDFFTWTDAPKCVSCPDGAESYGTGSLPPSPEELRWGASRVEGYKCTRCGVTLRFPRYNHPEKLLETRTGRCGEWANCFTLICKSVGFEARHVMDWTDHVWTEVYIPTWDRWLHCDPCENVCDRPLMYEKGWAKKLSLIVSTCAEQVVDVTWRYCEDRKSVTSRRAAMFDEDWLAEKLRELNDAKLSQLPAQRKIELQRRNLKEQLEIASVKKSDEEYGGRTSGSLAWRKARGETHGDDVVSVSRHDSVQWGDNIVPTEEELVRGFIHLTYSSSKNTYVRLSNNGEVVDEWETLACRWLNVMRKEEFDWKKAYLCRVEGSTERGSITWRINLPDGRHVTSVSLRVASDTFDTGKVAWLLASDRRCDVIMPGKAHFFESEYKGSRCVSVNAVMSGGNGDCGWQKAQLFRESTKAREETSSFDLKVSFEAS